MLLQKLWFICVDFINEGTTLDCARAYSLLFAQELFLVGFSGPYGMLVSGIQWSALCKVSALPTVVSLLVFVQGKLLKKMKQRLDDRS